jgi:8-oxo-dGTP pyrophosphatase MutT (NUDIX family)|tara:strand:+ start:4699 stop:5220 length:522 start_codon:yes stop_codon:yes gene_type:complete
LDNNRRKTIYQGTILDFGLEKVQLGNGKSSNIEIVRHPGGAGILAIDKRGYVCLLRQYRYSIKDWIWEIPAGLIDRNEEPLNTAKRELREEAGLVAEEWKSLGSILPTPGFCNEKIFLYEARTIRFVGSNPEAVEQIEIHWVTLSEALDMAVNNQIVDAKTIAILLRTNQVMA